MPEDSSQKTSWRRPWGRQREGHDASRRKRVLARVGVVTLLVALFVIIPGYIALQPKFLQRYERLGGAYDSWSTSAHASVPCRRCHVSPKPLDQAKYAATMLGEFYLSAVLPSRQPALFKKPTNQACLSCHIDLRTVSPSGDLNIPHRAHVTVLKMRCVQCHNFLVHRTNPQGKHTPAMAGCLRCHNGRTAKKDCSACHTNKVKPLSHRTDDWLVVHADQKDLSECIKCHKWSTDQWCSHCHAQRPASHGSDWRAKHPAQVAKHRNCEACHVASFCIRCHGKVPSLNFNPALRLVP